MFNYGTSARLRNFRGLGALDLLLNKAVFNVGEAPMYSITGAKPDTTLAWSSTRDGLPTGEYQSDYGQKTDALGVWSGAGGAFTPTQVGTWTKTASVGGENDTVSFQVLPLATSNGGGNVVYIPSGTTQTQQAQAPGFFDETINLFGYNFPKWAVYAVGAGAIYWTFFKKR